MNNKIYIDGFFLDYKGKKIPLSLPIFDLKFDMQFRNRIENYIEFVNQPDFVSLPLYHKLEEIKKSHPHISSEDFELFSKITSDSSEVYIFLSNDISQYIPEMKEMFLDNLHNLFAISNQQISVVKKLQEKLALLETCKDPDFVAVEKNKIEESLNKKANVLQFINDFEVIKNLLDEAFPSVSVKKSNKIK